MARRVRSSKQKKCTLRISAELILIILEHLPPASVIAFVLTCRALFAQFFPSPVLHSSPGRATLLQYLARDIPQLHFCHNCHGLHRWRVIRGFSDGILVCRVPCRITPFTLDLMDQQVADYGSNLTYSLAHLVINRHLYGPGHGPRYKILP